MDPRLEALWRKQQLELKVLFDQFRAANPNLPIDIDGVDWPADKDAEWGDFTRELDAAHRAEREALAVIIDGEQ